MHENSLNCVECIKMHERYYPLLKQYQGENKEILNFKEREVKRSEHRIKIFFSDTLIKQQTCQVNNQRRAKYCHSNGSLNTHPFLVPFIRRHYDNRE